MQVLERRAVVVPQRQLAERPPLEPLLEQVWIVLNFIQTPIDLLKIANLEPKSESFALENVLTHVVPVQE